MGKSINLRLYFTFMKKLILSACFSLTIILSAINTASAQVSDPAKTETTKQNLQTVKLKVSGITCKGDIKDISGRVTNMTGVADCKHEGKLAATSAFLVSFDPAVISEKAIRSVVEDTPGCTDPNDRPYKVKG